MANFNRGDDIILSRENKSSLHFGQVCFATNTMILVNTYLDAFFELVECEFDEGTGNWRAMCAFPVDKKNSFPTEEQYQPLLKHNLPLDVFYQNWKLEKEIHISPT